MSEVVSPVRRHRPLVTRDRRSTVRAETLERWGRGGYRSPTDALGATDHGRFQASLA